MTPKIYELNGSGRLIYIAADRFKSEWLSLSFLMSGEASLLHRYGMLLSLAQYRTKRFSSKGAINRYLDTLYSSGMYFRNQRIGDVCLFGLDAEFLAARFVDEKGGLLPKVVALMAELLFAPYTENGTYTDEAVELMKRSMTDELLSLQNNPYAVAKHRCRELLLNPADLSNDWGDRLRELQAADGRSLCATKDLFLGQICPIFTYVGSMPPTQVLQILNERFGTLCAPPVSYRVNIAKPQGAPQQDLCAMPVEQSRLAIGFRGDIAFGDPLANALPMLNEIFGGNAASKLFLKVREEQGLCYHCASTAEVGKRMLFAEAGIAASKRERVQEAMLAQFEAICKGGISEAELDHAARSLSLSFRRIYDSPSALADFYTRRALLGVEETIEQRRDRVLAVRPCEVIAAANTFHCGAVCFLEGKAAKEDAE